MHNTASPIESVQRRLLSFWVLIDRVDPATLLTQGQKKRLAQIAVWAPVIPLVIVLDQFALIGRDPRGWDLMAVSGFTAVIFGLWLFRGQRGRMEEMLKRLSRQGVLELPDQERERLYERAEATAIRRSHRAGALLLLLMVVVIPVVIAVIRLPEREYAIHSKITLLSTLFVPMFFVSAYLVGRAIGRLAWYSFFWRLTERREVEPESAHIDGLAGLKPVGDYYFTHALILAVPITHLLLWTVLIPFWRVQDYDQWQIPYGVLLFVALTLEGFVFVTPLWRFHVRMREKKAKELAQADEKSRKISELRERLADELSSDERKKSQDDLDAMVQRYSAIESMPTWPVSRRITRLFAGNYAVFLSPLVIQLTGGEDFWKEFSDAVDKFLS